MAEGGRRIPILGILAYVLVPGERRKRATGHFRRAGLEVLKGVGELARPEGRRPSTETELRGRIEIEKFCDAGQACSMLQRGDVSCPEFRQLVFRDARDRRTRCGAGLQG